MTGLREIGGWIGYSH